jgi:tripartite-type tricarboxylate transporter receptor subunit TctC
MGLAGKCLLGGALFAALCVAGNARSQGKPSGLPGGYPSKPVRVIVSAAPGGGADFLGRLIFGKLGELWGSAFNAENMGTGVGGIPAMEITMKAHADGYTLLVTSSSSYLNAAFMAPVSWDVRKAFTPVSPMSLSTLLVAASMLTPYANLKEMIAYAKANPNAISFGVPGMGSSPHLAGELMQYMAGFKMIPVPYKGTGQSVIDTIAGRVPLVIGSVTALVPHVKNGKIKAIGVTASVRVPSAPEFETLAEAGLPGFDYSGWFGIVGPPGMPQPIVNALNEAITRVIGLPDIRLAMLKNSADPLTATPEKFRGHILEALDKTDTMLKATGLRIGSASRAAP